MKVPGPAEPDPDFEVPALPKGVTLLRVYSDFIGYLHKHTMAFFVKHTPNGGQIWNRLHADSKIQFVFCIPNGWDISQQIFLREAAKHACIVNSSDPDDRISFTTESEASVHYVLAHTKVNTWLNKSSLFAVIDVGGSTVDSILYECRGTQPLRLEEICASQCIQVRLMPLVIYLSLRKSTYSRPGVYLWIVLLKRC
jgi:hypothetical protein